MAVKANAFAAKCYELVSFLVDRLGVAKVAARFEGAVAYHEFALRPARDGGYEPTAQTVGERRRVASRCAERR